MASYGSMDDTASDSDELYDTHWIKRNRKDKWVSQQIDKCFKNKHRDFACTANFHYVKTKQRKKQKKKIRRDLAKQTQTQHYYNSNHSKYSYFHQSLNNNRQKERLRTRFDINHQKSRKKEQKARIMNQIDKNVYNKQNCLKKRKNSKKNSKNAKNSTPKKLRKDRAFVIEQDVVMNIRQKRISNHNSNNYNNHNNYNNYSYNSYTSKATSEDCSLRSAKYEFKWPFAVSSASAAHAAVSVQDRAKANDNNVKTTFGELTEYGVSKVLLNLGVTSKQKNAKIFYDLGMFLFFVKFVYVCSALSRFFESLKCVDALIVVYIKRVLTGFQNDSCFLALN